MVKYYFLNKDRTYTIVDENHLQKYLNKTDLIVKDTNFIVGKEYTVKLWN